MAALAAARWLAARRAGRGCHRPRRARPAAPRGWRRRARSCPGRCCPSGCRGACRRAVANSRQVPVPVIGCLAQRPGDDPVHGRGQIRARAGEGGRRGRDSWAHMVARPVAPAGTGAVPGSDSNAEAGEREPSGAARPLAGLSPSAPGRDAVLKARPGTGPAEVSAALVPSDCSPEP